jgi:hypothetical protein
MRRESHEQGFGKHRRQNTMKVGLIQVDGKMPNLALMKLSAFHKKKGDQVVLVDLSTLKVDHWYGSKIFMGGSGFDLHSKLPPEVEELNPDYELYNMSKGERIGFTSRGCIRNCGFCIVQEKEGTLHNVGFEWVNGAEKVILLDNNFLASSLWKDKLEYFIRHETKVCFTQGLDIRLINMENAKILSKVLYYNMRFSDRRLYFAFDDPALEQIIKEKVKLLNENGIPSNRLMFYVLVGFNTTLDQDLYRIQILKDLGCLPFVMVYNRKKDSTLRRLARWVNKRYYMVVFWSEFK